MSTTPISSQIVEKELSRLLSAAVVNHRFRRLLLTNPASALANGYNGEIFCLDREDQDFILSIRAKNLTDFAKQLVDIQHVVNLTKVTSGIYTI